MPYVLAETVVITWLATQLAELTPTPSFDDELPYNLGFVMPLIVVERFGGADGILGLDTPTVDVDVFALTKDQAMTLAEQVRLSLRRDLPAKTVAGATVSKVRTVSGPARAAWDDTQARRVTASYQLTLHQRL